MLFLTSSIAGVADTPYVIAVPLFCGLSVAFDAENLPFTNQQIADHFRFYWCFRQNPPQILVVSLHVGLTRGWVKRKVCRGRLFRCGDTQLFGIVRP